jgi:membrane peptidoglycan carboxypeptidase
MVNSMNGTVPSDLAQSPSPAARVSFFVNKRRLKHWLWWFAALLGIIALAVLEVRTSVFQSWLFTRINERIEFQIVAGRSASIAFPRAAPFDDRRGYSKLSQFQPRLEAQGFKITQQVEQSETLRDLIRRGISPPYIELPGAGIDIRGPDDASLFRYAQSEFLFAKIEEVPPLLVKSLVFLENRNLGRRSAPWQNPAIEWDRLLKAGLFYIGSRLYIPVPVQGGSTLAVQLEKFRHSPNGRTDTPAEKFRQVIAASLKAYRDGKNTRAWRERIIVDYLNTVPLAAAPGYGEIHGLGEGLYAWFGMPLRDVVKALNTPGITSAKLKAYKQVLTLLVSVRAPSVFLVEERASLEEKVGQFTRLLARGGVIDSEMASALHETPITFLPSAPLPPQPSSRNNKAANAIRTTLMDYLGITNLYDLNRLHLEARSTIDVALQKRVTDYLNSLADPEVVKAAGLNGERLLENADPGKVIYSFLLVEPTPEGNVIRVQADNLAAPFDFNRSVKLELGSTAKLRTVTHYLEIIAELYKELSPLDHEELRKRVEQARDPLTRWAGETLLGEKNIALGPFLSRAMERRYSASPYEAFFTGGGLHHFENFQKEDNQRILPLREAFRNSVNLVFIRLMRDIVSYHRARLSYNPDDVLGNPANPERRRFLGEIAAEESLSVLRRAYLVYRNQTPEQILARLLGTKGNADRRLTILFFAWHIGADEKALADWLEKNQEPATADVVSKLFRAYHNPRLTLVDYAYLLSRHPLDLWCASEFRKNPGLSWEALYAVSRDARRMDSAWLLQPRNRRAQDLRLRIRIEKDAFDRMLPYWQRLGFPFKTIVPSYATAIGSSSDRPVALAELVGILVNDGMRRPATSLAKIHFARGTPYETLFERSPVKGEQVLLPEVARTVRRVMTEVVEQGTARRLQGVFRLANGTLLTVGGKTGSGDNRFETFNRYGGVTSSRPTNRTAAFVFYIGDRYFGVITAYVQGRDAGDYHFTSALPVTILRLLSPTLMAKLDNKLAAPPEPVAPGEDAHDAVEAQKINFAVPGIVPADALGR